MGKAYLKKTEKDSGTPGLFKKQKIRYHVSRGHKRFLRTGQTLCPERTVAPAKPGPMRREPSFSVYAGRGVAERITRMPRGSSVLRQRKTLRIVSYFVI
jgi:hypothetical protein